MDPNSTPGEPQEPVVPAQVVDRPPAGRPRKKTSTWGMLLLVLLLLGLAGSVVLNVILLIGSGAFDTSPRVQEKFFSHSRYGSDKIVIISIDGVILGGDGYVKRQIDQAAKDDDVKAVVLRVNSPGGTVTGSDYLYHHLCKLSEESEIPIVVSMGGLAASGGYYVSMAVGDTPDSIFAERTTWTGSIGVIMPHYNVAKLMKEWGVEEDSVTSHPLKNMGSFAQEMSEEEHAIFQELVDESLGQFKSVIRAGRPNLTADALDKLATGQVFTAEQAKKEGLIDRIGFIEAAIDRAIKLAGVDEDDVCVIKYQPEPTLADILFGGAVSSRGFDLAALLDMATPRAYYLWTRIPPLVRSGR